MAPQIDACLIKRRQTAAEGVAGMLDHRAPAPLRNHARDNVMAMREKVRQQRGKNIIEMAKPQQPDFKLKQFGNVKSRLFDLPRATPNDKLQRSKSSPCVSARQPPEERNENVEEDRGEEGETGEEMDLASFEAEIERLKKEHGRKPAAAAKGYRKDAERRPAYLQKIKNGLAEQQRQAERERRGPLIPQGYRQMPESERQETLDALQAKRDDLEKAFQRLPFNIETASQVKRSETILKNITESDAAIKKFSNPMVLVEDK